MIQRLAPFALTLLALSIPDARAANETQYIDCKFPNPASNDHVVVSLNDSQSGSFFYTTGVSDDGDDQDTGRIGLIREDSKTDPTKALFVARWMTVQDGSKVTLEFHFSMPKELIFKASGSFKAGLTTNIIDGNKQALYLKSDDDLTCFSRLNTKSTPSKK